MARPSDVRRIARSLPETVEGEDGFGFSVRTGTKDKGFAWVWRERVDPGRARVPQPKVLVVRVANGAEKEALIASDPEKFFTEPHYNGYPAVLVRLAAIGVKELRELLTDAWRTQAPKALVKDFDAGRR
ncbi:MAG TPA: MmcQ/YjbR family DNA-binding protein [Acidimicrobiia bacterium]|nr:MmcQ/YjbR family DNA-binding protein [Acidimicrobiia bacterium]